MLGKIFEDNPEVMLQSLQAIKELPPDTLIFPGKLKYHVLLVKEEKRIEERRDRDSLKEKVWLIEYRNVG